MSIHGELSGYLRSHVPERHELSKRLDADERVYCYYICPLSTLRQILAQGIKCHSSPHDSVDLSSPDVQSHRKAVGLCRSTAAGSVDVLTDVPIHSCVNLYWNPLNLTFEAFQRNALLRAAESDNLEHGIVCLLEIDVERLLDDNAAYWTVTDGNAASPHVVASSDPSRFSQFPWESIYRLDDGQERSRTSRAAELMVFLGRADQPHTDPVPPSSFTRVLLPDVRLSKEQETWLESTGLPSARVAVHKRPADLLKAESRFLENACHYRLADGEVASRLALAFRLITQFELRFGGPSADLFASSWLAHSEHGVGHTTRVMFWAAFLAASSPRQAGDAGVAAVLAARLHDLCRNGQGTDRGHGARAAAQFGKLVEEVLDEPELQLSCASAVRMHDVDDSKCPPVSQDWLWAVLKDADGLDRGRFAPPTSANGCDKKQLRLSYLASREGLTVIRQRLPWLAYWLAGMTKSSGRWDNTPCRRLLTDVVSGIHAGLRQGVLQGGFRNMAMELDRGFSPVLDELRVMSD